MLVGGVIAAVVGMFAYRQMDDRRTEPLLPDLLAALRRGVRRGGSGVLIAIEGATEAETAEQARRLVGTLREHGHRVVVAGPGQLRAEPVAVSRSLAGPRAGALAEAAARADLVERVVRPALADGAIVVADRFLASPLVQLGVTADRMQAELDAAELESLAAFATGRLRPDVSVLLDRAPAPADADVPAGDDTTPIPVMPGEEHLRVRRLLTRMAAAEPHRYVVVEAEGTPDEVAQRVLAALTPVLPKPPVSKNGPGGTTGSSSPPLNTTIPSTSQSPAPLTAGTAGAETPTVGRASTAPAGAVPDGATTGSGAVTTVVDNGKITATGAKPAPVRFWHRWRRS
jgi:dTMP kinase